MVNLREKLSILKRALSEQKPLDDLGIAYIDDETFKKTRTALSPYTTKLRQLFRQLEADLDNSNFQEHLLSPQRNAAYS